MHDKYSDEAMRFLDDIERVRKELGKGMTIEEIAVKLDMEPAYAKFILVYGIIG